MTRTYHFLPSKCSSTFKNPSHAAVLAGILTDVVVTWAPKTVAAVGVASKSITGDNIIMMPPCRGLLASHVQLTRSSALCSSPRAHQDQSKSYIRESASWDYPYLEFYINYDPVRRIHNAYFEHENFNISNRQLAKGS